MNTSTVNFNEASIENVIIFLKECLSQLINYNSISSENLKKVCAINYKQLSNNSDQRIQNYLMNIFGEINNLTKVYNIFSEYIEDSDIIYQNILNFQFNQGLKR